VKVGDEIKYINGREGESWKILEIKSNHRGLWLRICDSMDMWHSSSQFEVINESR